MKKMVKVHTRVKRGMNTSTHLRGPKRRKFREKSGRPRKKFKTEESMLVWLEKNNVLEHEVVELESDSKYNFKVFINKQKLI